MLNLFSVHGKYFRNDENRLTANFLVLLSENRSTFLPAFLKAIGITSDSSELTKAEIRFQVPIKTVGGWKIPDAEILLGDRVRILIEAKIGQAGLRPDQIREYATNLASTPAAVRRLVCITQIADRVNFNKFSESTPAELPDAALRYMRWYEIIRMLERSLGLGDEAAKQIERAVRRGRSVPHGERLATLLLEELEQTMYERVVVDDLPLGSTPEVTVTTQDPWFMKVARSKRVWFPSGSTQHGLTPSAYVAYYEVDKPGNDKPKHITHIAKNRIYWNRISLSDAREIPELKHLFRDQGTDREISSWGYGEDGTFHLVLTEKPVRLRVPIPLGKKNVARVLSKRKTTLVSLMNARSVDDLF